MQMCALSGRRQFAVIMLYMQCQLYLLSILPVVIHFCQGMHVPAELERPDLNPVSMPYRQWQLHASTAATHLQGKQSALTSPASLLFEMRALLRSETALLSLASVHGNVSA